MKSPMTYLTLATSAVALVACSTGSGDENIFGEPQDSVPTESSPAGIDPQNGGPAGGGPAGAEGAAGAPQVERTSIDDTVASDDAGDGPTLDDFNSALIGDPVEYDDDARNAGADLSAMTLGEAELDAVFDGYDRFLAGADAVRLDGEAGDPDLAGTGLVDDRLADHRDELDADFGKITGVQSFANIERVSGSAADWVVLEDCTEVSTTSSLSVVSSDFVRQDVWLELGGDTWSVTAVHVIHDGSLDSRGERGCVPHLYAERAEAVTDEFIRLESAGADAEVVALAKVTTDEFFQSVTADGLPSATVDPAGIEVAIVGHDALAGTRTLYLEACVESSDGIKYQEYEVTRGLLNGFPDFGDDLDVYGVSARLPAESVDACPIGDGS